MNDGVDIDRLFIWLSIVEDEAVDEVDDAEGDRGPDDAWGPIDCG